MEVLLHSLPRCPENVELVVFARLVHAEMSKIVLEDLLTHAVSEIDVIGDATIPEDLGLPVKIECKKNSADDLEVIEIHVVENKQLLRILADTTKLKMLDEQASRGITIYKSRLREY